MGTVWLARKSFADARQFATRGGDASGLSKEAPGRYQPGELEVLASALAGRIPVRIIGHGDKDVHAALRLIEEFALPRVRLEGLLEGYRAPAAISALDALIIDVIPSNPLDASQPVAKPLALLELQAWLDGSHPSGCPCCGLLLNASADDSADDPRVIRAAYGLRADNVAIVASRNPRCAISTHGEVPRLLEAAAWAVRHGLAPSVALELVTRRPAEMLGLGDELGILAVGRRADVVVLSGDPFEITSHVLAVYSSGKLVCLTRDEVRR
jgi:imidazolonepropionase-like amidohydrolase